MNRPKSGFTLIELLVVIAIIGTLSSILISQINIARKKATDSSIKQDLSSISSAIELKRLDTNQLGVYASGSNQAKYEYGLACSTTPSTGTDSGQIFRDAAAKGNHQLNSAVCVVYGEPIPPYPLSPGHVTQAVKYYVDASGNVVRFASVVTSPLTSYWAAAVQLSDGSYYCVDETGFVGTTSSLNVDVNNPACINGGS